MTLYEKRDGNTTVIQLSVKGRFWAQFAFQFAHELCHVFCNYDRIDLTESPNQWFEETLGETASLFALRRMATTWQTAPPYPNWASYAASLGQYATDRRAEPANHLPAGVTLAGWFALHQDELRANPYQREKNTAIASHLLPLFEDHPESWEAVRYLNAVKPERTKTFQTYLREWHDHCPKKYQPFVAQIAAQFGVTL